MNIRQFISSSVCRALEAKRLKWLGQFLRLFPRFFFPGFSRYIQFEGYQASVWWLMLKTYGLVFVMSFLVQAILSYCCGTFFVDDDPLTKNFLEDYLNMANYILIVEAYCISGVLFVYFSYSTDEQLVKSGLVDQLGAEIESERGASSFVSIVIIFAASLLGISAYGLGQYDQGVDFWYMPSRDGGVELREYAWNYYLLLNLVLLQFVIFVALGHLRLFRVALGISDFLKEALESGGRDQLQKWTSDHEIKQWFAPFSRITLISKVFVLSILINMVAWKSGDANRGAIFDLAVLVVIIAGMWVVTIPRYYLQYCIFKIRSKVGLDEYKDIRMSWFVGGSAFVDMVLILIASKVLLNNEAFAKFVEAVNN